jgi:hypothetical protein
MWTRSRRGLVMIWGHSCFWCGPMTMYAYAVKLSNGFWSIFYHIQVPHFLPFMLHQWYQRDSSSGMCFVQQRGKNDMPHITKSSGRTYSSSSSKKNKRHELRQLVLFIIISWTAQCVCVIQGTLGLHFILQVYMIQIFLWHYTHYFNHSKTVLAIGCVLYTFQSCPMHRLSLLAIHFWA